MPATAPPAIAASGRPAPPPPTGAPAPAGRPPIASGTAPAKSRILAPRERKAITPRIVINAIEGFGKTTIGAYSPDPVVFMSPGETGYDTLLSSNLVPQVPAVSIESWTDLLGWCDELIKDPQGRKTLVLDALGGFERLCHEHVCHRDFKDDWSDKGFSSYMRGYDVSVTDWLHLLARLERLNDAGMTIVILSHCKVKTFKNPLGADYDRYVADVHDKTWSPTAKWADVVLFGKFFTSVEVARSTGNVAKDKGKGIGGTERILYSQQRDAFDAKNRYGMPPELDMPNDPTAAWSTIWNAITVGSASG